MKRVRIILADLGEVDGKIEVSENGYNVLVNKRLDKAARFSVCKEKIVAISSKALHSEFVSKTNVKEM